MYLHYAPYSMATTSRLQSFIYIIIKTKYELSVCIVHKVFIYFNTETLQQTVYTYART